MNPLSSIFGAGVRARNALYDRGIARANSAWSGCKRRELVGWRIGQNAICAGSRGTAEGSRGEFDILSRGYGRRTRGVARVDPEACPRTLATSLCSGCRLTCR